LFWRRLYRECSTVQGRHCGGPAAALARLLLLKVPRCSGDGCFCIALAFGGGGAAAAGTTLCFAVGVVTLSEIVAAGAVSCTSEMASSITLVFFTTATERFAVVSSLSIAGGNTCDG
jgi:hypothetical protein